MVYYESGSTNLTSQSHFVTTGEHTFHWVYYRDSTLGDGVDTVWLDNISFPGYHPVIAQAPCPEGTYQPESGQSSCIDAEIGHYVDSIANCLLDTSDAADDS